MPRFFVKQDQIGEGRITLLGEDAHHIARSLRMAVGDMITVCDMRGNEYRCRISDFDDDDAVCAEILSVCESDAEPIFRIRLFQALPKGDKLDTIIQKAVECGASDIIPFESERCVVRIKPEAEQRKTERRQRIATEAAKQCGRSALPIVYPTVSFSQMLDSLGDGLCLFCYEGDGTEALGSVLKRELPLLDDREGATVSVIIGSEGGFSPNEAQRIINSGGTAVGLGKRILRTETASGFVLACLVYASELGGNG